MSNARLTQAQSQAGSNTRLPGAGHGERWALVFGSLGVLGFSLTFPAIRMAVPTLGGTVVGLGRALIAAALAVVLLRVRHERLPARRHWRGLVTVAVGVVIGFPLCSSLALRSLPAAHGAVVVGLLPAATAIVAVLLAGERPSLGFWLACGCGVMGVLLFAWVSGAGRVVRTH
ncbi:MAG: EamA family transporter [Dehalococcoidia bacterium]